VPCCEEKSSIQNCEALQIEGFLPKTRKIATARLAPAVAILRSIGEKDPVWSV
jgi:hypothetical protein